MTPLVERSTRGDAPRRRGRWERLMFSFMGPPQLGDLNAPSARPHDPRADLCGRCGQPWDGHERVSTSSMTYMRCPSPEQ